MTESPAGGGTARARLTLLARARREALAAAEYYDDEVEGLGDEFLAELERVLARVAEAPAAGSPMRAGRRRMFLRRFPYAVVYRELAPGRVRVIAVQHHRQRPEYWAARDR